MTVTEINLLADLREECDRAIKDYAPGCCPALCAGCPTHCDLEEIGKVLYRIEQEEM
jgi:hypothetical protein